MNKKTSSKLSLNITLIGMPAAGKSWIGKQLSKQLGYHFFDVDKGIEKKINGDIQTFINTHDDAAFLSLEEQVVLELGAVKNTVISTGGSVVYSDVAMVFLQEISFVVYLKESLENIDKRLQNLDSRGVVGLKNKTLTTLFNQRTPLYERYADLIFKMPKEFHKSKITDTLLDILKGKDIS